MQALDRRLVILEALAQMHSGTLGDLALHVDMPPSTVHRILATLQNHGFTDFDTVHQEWAIGIGAFRVGNSYLVCTNLIEAAQRPEVVLHFRPVSSQIKMDQDFI